MSLKYNEYLSRHKQNVKRGFNWILEHIPEVLAGSNEVGGLVNFHHDNSKFRPDEYNAYDAYFYGGNQSYAVCKDFDKAWLLHIHRNPHHWQHWILIPDDPNESEIYIEMPYDYIIEMICDWWSFSWDSGDLTKIFAWWDDHKDHIKLHRNSRKAVEDILGKMRKKLEEYDESESLDSGS